MIIGKSVLETLSEKENSFIFIQWSCCNQCCGAGPFLTGSSSGSGSSLTKIPAPAPALIIFPI
jgi:hypothetical protein